MQIWNKELVIIIITLVTLLCDIERNQMGESLNVVKLQSE